MTVASWGDPVTALSQIFWQECHRVDGIGLGTFPTPWFAWALSAGLLEVLGPLLDPSKTCSILVCLPLCFSRLHRVGRGYCWWHWSVPWPVPLFSSFYSQYFFEISCSEGDECLKWLTNGPAFLILTFIPCRPGSSCHGGGGGGGGGGPDTKDWNRTVDTFYVL